MLNVKSINADQIDVNDSLKPRVDITAQDISASIPVNPRIEYLYSVSEKICRDRNEMMASREENRPYIREDINVRKH